MNFLQKFKKIKNNSDSRFSFKAALHFLERCFRLFTFLIDAALVSYCVYIWYGAIYHAGWSDDQKQKYLQNKAQATTFNKKGFEYDVSAINARQEESQKNWDSPADIFHLNQNSSATPDIPTTSIAPSTPLSPSVPNTSKTTIAPNSPTAPVKPDTSARTAF